LAGQSKVCSGDNPAQIGAREIGVAKLESVRSQPWKSTPAASAPSRSDWVIDAPWSEQVVR